MKKSIAIVTTILPLALVFIGNSAAQQAPPANTQQGAASGAQQAPASGTKQTATPQSSTAQGTKSTQTPGAKKTTPPLTLKTDKDKNSYAIGMNIGKGLKRDAVDVDPAILARGIKDALAGQKTLLTDDEAKTVLTALQNEMRKKQLELRQQAMEAQKQAGEANKKEGEAFLTENKTKDGVVTLPSGLQYKILKGGDGPKPTATDSVVCNYRGTLINGTEFDSSYGRGQPATFGVGQVIKGWTEALQLMPVGSKWQLFVPAELAYGERAPGGAIGPNSTLIFEVELLSIQPKEQPKDAKQPSAP
jgi:FKBP-type peptidyl-prolyl cis-trans isomerase FklB